MLNNMLKLRYVYTAVLEFPCRPEELKRELRYFEGVKEDPADHLMHGEYPTRTDVKMEMSQDGVTWHPTPEPELE